MNIDLIKIRFDEQGFDTGDCSERATRERC